MSSFHDFDHEEASMQCHLIFYNDAAGFLTLFPTIFSQKYFRNERKMRILLIFIQLLLLKLRTAKLLRTVFKGIVAKTEKPKHKKRILNKSHLYISSQHSRNEVSACSTCSTRQPRQRQPTWTATQRNEKMTKKTNQMVQNQTKLNKKMWCTV